MRLAAAVITPVDIAAARTRHPALFGSHPLRWRRRAAVLGFGTAVLWCLWYVDFSPLRLWQGLGKLGWLLPKLFPPGHGGWLDDFALGMAETLAMALLGTTLAAIIAFPLGFLGAKTLLPNLLMHFSLRRLFDGVRAVDALVWALVFVSAVGLGPFAGVLAIATSDVGVFAKIFAEAIENADRRQLEGVRAAGGSGAKLVRFGVLPQAAPAMLSAVLYYFESNVRHATILGVVGAGGIGHHLSDRIRVNNWDEVAFIVLMILVAVAAIDFLSGRLRFRLIGGATTARSA
jgi:phosphonate transport system permease protein